MNDRPYKGYLAGLVARLPVFLVFLGAFVVGPAPAGGESLQQRASVLVSACQKATGCVAGVSAVDLRTGETLVAIRDKQLFIPASNAKLLTGAFALARLGGDFKFVTSVYLLGDDILIRGDYDPTPGDPRLAAAADESIYAELDRWAAAVKRRVGERFAGDVLVCDRRGGRAYRHPDWPTSHPTSAPHPRCGRRTWR